ncbi:hypothetical protein MCEMIH16_00644 [Caulobacteraceae bacterium]
MRIGLFAGVAVAGFVVSLAQPSWTADEAMLDTAAFSTL